MLAATDTVTIDGLRYSKDAIKANVKPVLDRLRHGNVVWIDGDAYIVTPVAYDDRACAAMVRLVNVTGSGYYGSYDFADGNPEKMPKIERIWPTANAYWREKLGVK